MSDHPDLFGDEPSDDELLPYNGTAGSVNQPASRDRANTEAASGKAAQRARTILARLAEHPNGLTYQQVGDLLGLHHGQSSGALSILHSAGHVFMLHKQLNRCHLYVHSQWRDRYPNEERIDEPASTQARRRREELEQLLTSVIEAIRHGDITDTALIAYAMGIQHNK